MHNGAAKLRQIATTRVEVYYAQEAYHFGDAVETPSGTIRTQMLHDRIGKLA